MKSDANEHTTCDFNLSEQKKTPSIVLIYINVDLYNGKKVESSRMPYIN